MGAEPVIVLYASISVLNWMRAVTGSQCKDTKRGVTWALLGSLKTSRAAAPYLLTVISPRRFFHKNFKEFS